MFEGMSEGCLRGCFLLEAASCSDLAAQLGWGHCSLWKPLSEEHGNVSSATEGHGHLSVCLLRLDLERWEAAWLPAGD